MQQEHDPDARTAARPRPARTGLRVPTPGDRTRLVLASALMLFVELALIRWTSSNNLYLVHMTNFVLLASFLGIGLGFLRARASRDLFPLGPILLVTLVGFVLAFPVRTGTGRGGRWQLVGLLDLAPLPRWLSLSIIFALAVGTLMALAQEVARTFTRFEALEAYRLDVMGSLTGIAAFAALSFLRLPPLGWGLVGAAVFVVLLGRRLRLLRRGPAIALGALVLLLGAESVAGSFQWSPYYKIHTTQLSGGLFRVEVNNTPLQTALPVANLRRDSPFYLYPYTYAGSRDDVLVIGAGTGNDVAVALAQGAKRVDAVEIDPAIMQLGRDHHPDRPYSDPRVTTHVDDGRAFMERTDRHYDLILLALPDSATIVTGQSALRLENYLFTTQALTQARSLLKPDGTFAMYNYYEPWLLDRYANTVRTVYAASPCVQLGPSYGPRQQAVLTLRKDASTGGCTTTWTPRTAALEPSVDDRPFPYLGTRTIPSFYLWMLGLVLLASLAAVRTVAGPLTTMRPYVDLFFMGAAFLLLETKNVVQFALLFGTTWAVNAAVFAGVLLSVLAAIEVARRVTIRRPILLYAGLLAALAAAWLIPQDALLDLSLVPRFLAGVTIAFLPIFVANLLFAVRFKGAGSSTVAFGANLLGAMVGGALEYLALIFGFDALLIVVALLYGLALLTGRKHLVTSRA
ncbi:Spermine/spermidine synthase [Pedococcus dokdonensis]|uniref:Spermine/spermidine synthase n=1 Tax=Pedococcus dokdonensis TaxID=443156 RepID=A0A1H0PEC5_9MICO|nr:methyltransferase domain-containing protein [Pedococcus dokdonensis]SDP03364.1 Spermine/spermidine synthase [Pedococcus dokdonensis]